MTPSDFNIMPAAETVADLVDGGCVDAAVERWGWLDRSAIWKLTTEGRRRSGRARPTGRLGGSGSEFLLDPRWDGPEISAPRLTHSTAAAALGISAASLVRGW